MPSSKETADDRPRADDDETMEDEFEPEEGGRFIGDIYIPPPPPAACTMESKGPRLIITHIENYFFKSYANTQVLGPFHKSFTSIVGPNGSGKSNVIDSMLFVFGYRAQKIRTKKLSVLLHNSDRYPDVQTARVTVYFQHIIDKEGEDFEVVPNSQFSVSRTVNKDNSSYYQINSRKVQFKEVGKLLRSHGIDLDHNRFLILQGEVEQIAMMKPKGQGENDCGMLEFLEDIVGSSRYKQPLEILEKRVEEFSELRVEKLNRLKVVEKEKDDLEGPKDEAIKYLEAENDLASERNKLWQFYVYGNMQEIQKAEEAKKQETEAMKELLDAMEEAKNVRAEKEKIMDEQKKELDKGKKRVDELNTQMSKLTTEDEKIGQDLKITNEQRKKVKKNIEDEKKKVVDFKSKLENNGTKMEEVQAARDRADEERKTLDADVTKLMKETKKETEGIQAQKDKVEMELIKLKENSQEAKQSVQIARSELEIYMSTHEKSKVDLETARNDLEAATELRQTRKGAIEALQTEVPQNERELSDAQNKLASLRQQEEKLLGDLRSKKGKLDEDRSAMQSARSNNRIVDALMEEKRKGNMSGIFGRLGDLGAIDPKYDVAISTACGQLEYIVTDNMETAQQVVNHLKRHNLGVTTCLDLQKQEDLRGIMDRPARFPENATRLFDLVQVKDERVRTAFYFALRDTLVANDLEQARRIAFGGRERYRVVTLNGDVIEVAGTMSGGGNRVIRGRMGQQVRMDTSRDAHSNAGDLSKLEQEVDRLSSALNVVRTDIRRLEDSCLTLEKRVKEGKINLQKFGMEMGALDEREKSLKNRVKECEQKLKESVIDKNKVKEMENEINTKGKLLDKAEGNAKVIEDKVAEFNAQIDVITNKKLKPAQKRLEEANKKWEKLKTEMSKLNAELTSSKRNLPKSEQKIEDMEKDLTEKENEIRANAEKRKTIEEKAKAVVVETEERRTNNEQIEEKLKEAKAEYDRTQKAENKYKAQKIDLDSKLEKFEVSIKENQARMRHFQKDIDKLKVQEVFGKEVEPLKKHSEEELKALDPKASSQRVTFLEEQLDRQPPNMNVLAEYKRKEEAYLERAKELDEITAKRDEARKHVDELKKARLNEFMSGFGIITTKLKEMYQMITLGGDAELELVDSLDPFTEGVVFSVRPPKKSWKNISNLSGGEKTLSSLALVFALHYYKPTPLYVMDEIDAALDFKNVSIVGNYVKERTKNAQFIIISLRSQMFELADRLVGIYKTHNCTKSTTINPHLVGKIAEEKEEERKA